MTDREKICRELSEACGRIWIEWDEKCGGSYTYIDGKKCSYLHPDEVLREVMKWKDFIEFIEKECKAEVWWQIPIAYIPSEFDCGAPYNEKGGECDCELCQRERRRERESDRVDDLIDEAREKR